MRLAANGGRLSSTAEARPRRRGYGFDAWKETVAAWDESEPSVAVTTARSQVRLSASSLVTV